MTGKGVHEEAVYEKEEIEGPLGRKGMKDTKVERDEVKGPLAGAGR